MTNSEKVLKLMQDGELRTAHKVADELNMTYNQTSAAFALLHKAKLVYISDWEWRKNVLARIYKIGNDDDAYRPSSAKAKENLERRLHNMMIAQGRIPFNPKQPRCDIAASWIPRHETQTSSSTYTNV